ncbi:hypothetical protein OG735_23565 [Streptomyces sp. NBC_01210]|uniref:hypothetical protein n=1 Tax=Streptomyces sp. NBC_01210 TaxID=2903774 RepID=UPI002E120D27|nr:hypothetical protein OG735_23565 [Streptomyces sp. NBC_01210]
MERKRRLAATLTAAAITTVIGAGGAAAAQAQPEDGIADLVVHAQSKLDSPNPDRPKKGCVDIDSVGNEASQSHAKYVAAVCDGKVYVLTVNENSKPGIPVGGWQAVGGPSKVVDVTLASNVFDVAAGPVFITALTSTGTVWEGACANTVPLGPCTFYQLPTPPQ